MTGRLSVELVPATAWWSNVRSNVTRAEWEICKTFVKTRSGNGDPSQARCEVCGGRGSRYPVDCHETWDYSDETWLQTLVGLIALCPPCHEVKHIGRALRLGNLERAMQHLARVNDWTLEHADHYVALQLQIHAVRSEHPWRLDIDYLKTLNIDPIVKDRA